MRVLINRYAALGARTGVGHYTVELLRCLRELAPGQIDVTPRGWLFQAEQMWNRLRPYLRPDSGPRGAQESAVAAIRLSVWKRAWKELLHSGRHALTRHVCAAATRHAYDLYHEPNHIPFPIDLPTVVTIHDLSVLLFPEWHPQERVAEFARFHRDMSRCRHILAVSEFTRQEIIRTLNVPPERVTCIYNGIRSGLLPLPRAKVAPVLRRLGLPREYLLYLGTLEPRKNLLTLLRAYCGLPASLRERFPLVLVGGWGWKVDAIADFLQSTAILRGVRHLGYVPDRHLAALYNGARALVYPSLYEGFGLPPVEMLACGGAVLASTAGALAETVGGQAHLIAPEDEDGWREGMARVLADDDWWAWLRQGAVAARPYRWERCAAETLNVYRAVCGEPVPLAA